MTNTERARCSCGKVITKAFAREGRCKACSMVARAARLEGERAIVAAGRCPRCGRGIRRNSSLTGWYQCVQSGAVGFRADAALPSCDWQTFTE